MHVSQSWMFLSGWTNEKSTGLMWYFLVIDLRLWPCRLDFITIVMPMKFTFEKQVIRFGMVKKLSMCVQTWMWINVILRCYFWWLPAAGKYVQSINREKIILGWYLFNYSWRQNEELDRLVCLCFIVISWHSGLCFRHLINIFPVLDLLCVLI